MEIKKDIFYDNNDIDIKNDLNNGQIYMIKNKINGKSYIGQASCFTGLNNKKWGTEGRWKSHIREALNNATDHCTALNNAIRKYGVESFNVLTLIKCPINDLNNYEIEFIKLYDTIQPNGYNIKAGGSKSKISEDSIAKMKSAHLGTRREKYKRKYEEDNHLPKYIKAHRVGGVFVAYVINKFPIGIEKTEYLKDMYFRLKPDKTKDELLSEAIQRLEELKIEYKHINEEIFKDKSDIKPKITLEEKRTKNINEKLPDNIFPILENAKIKGYYVDGLLDHNNEPYPRQIFTDKTNRWNLNAAKNYVKQLIHYRDNKIIMTDSTIAGKLFKQLDEKYYLPMYVNKYNFKG